MEFIFLNKYVLETNTYKIYHLEYLFHLDIIFSYHFCKYETPKIE